VNKRLLVIALYSLSLVACTPKVIKEPYPVREVREVYRPIPDEYTREMETPTLPNGPITCQVLAVGWNEWKAFGKTANEHRSKVGALTKDAEPEPQ
jgi:hypothetical protein